MKTTETVFDEDVLCACFQLFCKQGIRAVSMQDIVRNCNLSTKTIYDVYGNKEGLVAQVFLNDVNNCNKSFTNIEEKAKNAIHEMVLLQEYYQEKLATLNPIVMFDLQKHYNTIYEEIWMQKQRFHAEFFERNLTKGIEQELYRQDIDVDFVSTLWLANSNIVRDQSQFPQSKYTIQSITKQLFSLHIRSVINQNGIKELTNYNL